MKNLFILIAVILTSVLLASPLGRFYNWLFSLSSGFSGFIIPNQFGNFFDGILFSYSLTIPAFFSAFGGPKKYWWIGILLIPAVAFEIYFDLQRIYFPILLGILGWILGLGISKLILRLKP